MELPFIETRFGMEFIREKIKEKSFIDDAIVFSRAIGARETYLIHMSHQAGLHADTDANLPAHVHLAYDGLEIMI